MMLRVLPSNEDMLKHLKHPSGVKFHSMTMPVEWPDDSWTTRRLNEGAIKVVGKTLPVKKTEK